MTTASLLTHYREIKGQAEIGLQFFEDCLDKAGYIPYLSTISGGIRIFYGKIEIITGVALAIFLQAAAFFAPDSAQEDLWKETARALDFVVHGLANIARGLFEIFRFVNLICLVYDRVVMQERNKLRLGYTPPIDFANRLLLV